MADVTNSELRQQVEVLLARYVHAIDGRNRAEFAVCFAVDALVDYGPVGSWSGREHVVDGLLGIEMVDEMRRST